MTEEIQKSIDSLEEFKATVKRCCQEAEKLFEEIDADINEIKKQLHDRLKQIDVPGTISEVCEDRTSEHGWEDISVHETEET